MAASRSILLVVCDYPHTRHPFAGTFYENCALALQALGHHVEVLALQPYAPPVISRLRPRWRVWADTPRYEVRKGIAVHRPRRPHVPGVAPAFWIGAGAYLFCRSTARRMHARAKFDALIAFDVQQTGGFAWRLGNDLGIPSAGWAIGDDMRFPARSTYGRLVREALQRLGRVFYQSRELFELAAAHLQSVPAEMSERHAVLPHGIPMPPAMDAAAMRASARREWGVNDRAHVVLSIGRVCADKGIFELVEAVRRAVVHDPGIVCVQIGSMPGLDETDALIESVRRHPGLESHFRFLPACEPTDVWRHLCGADVFAFASHHEGMPNSLLEAMAAGVPCVAFAIPPVGEIDGGTGALSLVSPFETERFGDALTAIFADPLLRASRIARAKETIASRFTITSNLAAALSTLMPRANASPAVPSRIPSHTTSA